MDMPSLILQRYGMCRIRYGGGLLAGWLWRWVVVIIWRPSNHSAGCAVGSKPLCPQRLVDGHVRMLGDAPVPPDWTDIAHAVRVSFPIVETLDGGMLYPHLEVVSEAQPDAAGLSAVFLASGA